MFKTLGIEFIKAFFFQQARGQKRKIGWFPANYVKLLQGSARATPDNTLGGGTIGISPAPGTVVSH